MTVIEDLEQILESVVSEILRVHQEFTSNHVFYNGGSKIIIQYLVNNKYLINYEIYVSHGRVLVDIVYGSTRSGIQFADDLDILAEQLISGYESIMLNTIRYYTGKTVRNIELVNMWVEFV